MKSVKLFMIICVSSLLGGCITLQTPMVNSMSSFKDYNYFYITPTQDLTSGSGTTISGQYYSTNKSVNPSDVISGVLIKRGFIRLPELDKDKLNETFIVNYGESGRRELFLAYAIEITMQFISASDHKTICIATAEGCGETEADDIRIAINRAFKAVFAD